MPVWVFVLNYEMHRIDSLDTILLKFVLNYEMHRISDLITTAHSFYGYNCIMSVSS